MEIGVSLSTERSFDRDGGLCAVLAGEPLEGVLDQFAGVLEGQLLFDVSLVGLDSLDADMQIVSDLASAAALANEPEYGEFTVCQRLHRGLAGGRAADHLQQ